MERGEKETQEEREKEREPHISKDSGWRLSCFLCLRVESERQELSKEEGVERKIISFYVSFYFVELYISHSNS